MSKGTLEKVLNQKAFITAFLFAVFFGGFLAFDGLGKLENPEIPVKSAVVITPYPGASAAEVELEVTDVLEKAVQKLENIDFVESRSVDGMSEITINVDDNVRTPQMPQLYDHLRRKINDAKGSLPAGANDPIVMDDFGDVYGIFISVSADGYSYSELNDYVEYIKRELLLVDNIRRIEIFGQQTETVDIKFSTEKFAQLGINPMLIVQAINDQSSTVNPGSVVVGTERIRLSLGAKFKSIDDIKNLLVQLPGGGSFVLGEIATVERSFYTPKRSGLKYNGKNAMSLAVSVESKVNVVKIGEIFDNKIAEIQKDLPVGIEINKVYFQPERVSIAINGFMINLIESVLIVIIVLLFAMGLRSGLLIASGLIFTILGTFIVMEAVGIELQRVSLAAIIVAMGMLVDNAIVIADGILIDLKSSMDRKKAFINTAQKTAIPLLGATVIAILAFMPLGFSPGAAGEFLKSLFYVLAISLFLSWVFAMIQTPYMASWFYKKQSAKKQDENEDPYNNGIYRWFKNVLKQMLWHKTVFIIVTTILLFVSLWSFKFVRQEFMPGLDYPQYVIEYWLPQGSDIYQVERDLDQVYEDLKDWEGVENITIALGQTPARYTLLRPMNTSNNNYGELIVDAEDFETAQKTAAEIIPFLQQKYPQAFVRSRTYSPIFSEYLVEAKFTGPDPAVLHDLAEQAKEVMRASPLAQIVTDNWKNQSKILTPEYSIDQARLTGITRSNVANSLAIASNGLPVGALYQGEDMLPVILKMEEPIGKHVENIASVPVWGNTMNSTPLGQVIDSVKVSWQNGTIRRYDGIRAIKAQCNPVDGVTAPELWTSVSKGVEAIELPHGYQLEWLGDHKDSAEANENLFSLLPLAIGLMVLIIILLFNNLKQPMIVMGVVPLALVGVALGHHIMSTPFGFMGIIGTLGLIGMMIKNAIVLLDEINFEINNGVDQLNAIINSAVSRMRPVMMASLTTILGMIPLLFDVMFKGMAVAVMFGLLIGSLVTLLVVPVLYAILYRVNTKTLHD
ncbi:efflux RND transporter permease subunit [Saccharicrinis fermentans]|uniref:Cation efflux system protein CzcA n=1 Tax=Saccharicrinis fermentans DSM 9555 = JCM 21142 TaxID=869213 RepID=W7XTW4_9BACT|nr:efflux RND transporter permease subunit [Saccharicrinis fermentans]GAF01445.1 cation efflux system protein CzcA [Saccharicrinis fermentans DSM 9555 = JCM 21142]